MRARFWTERRAVAAVSLAATYLFFLEYLPPLARVHLFSDIEGYHYPLLQYAFDSLRRGFLPEWDTSIYCGLPFIGNVQAAFLYPPNWLMFLANAGREHLSFKGLEILVFAHVWLAFLLCYLWLRDRGLSLLAALLGGSVYAFSGYMMSQFNHVGVACGIAWTPLALWGAGQAASTRTWRPLWKVAAASALCFLAGFTPTWIVFCVVVLTYAAASGARWRTLAGVSAALAFSVLLVLPQLLPALQASQLKAYELKYGWGYRQPEFFAAFVSPNYFDLGRNAYGWGNPAGTYLYVGAPALFAVLWAVRRGFFRLHAQALAVGAISAAGLMNPFGLVQAWVKQSGFFGQAVHATSFLEGMLAAIALFSAVSLDAFLRRAGRRLPGWVPFAAAAVTAAWAVRQFVVWLPKGTDFASRWASAGDAAVSLAVFAIVLYVFRSEKGGRRAAAAVALLSAVFVDYKVFGTSRGFSAAAGDVDSMYAGGGMAGIDDAVYREMRAHPEYRVALDEDASPHSTYLRHYRLDTPQGFDPLLPAAYKAFIEARVKFRTDRLFWIGPRDKELMRRTGVRYFITMPGKPSHAALSADPEFRLLQPSQSFFNVFEYRNAAARFGWEKPAGGSADSALWLPSVRKFRVRSAAGGRFMLAEQCSPGWRVRIDGREARLERDSEGVFQAVRVPPGEHRLTFEYRSPGFRWGLAVSAIAIAALALFTRSAAAG